jgi:DNA-directed RNA polymerase subunit RPC12/RpoP
MKDNPDFSHEQNILARVLWRVGQNREASKKWKVNHPEEAKARDRKWIVAHPEIVRNRRLVTRLGSSAPEHIKEQIKTQNNKCAICLKTFSKTPHLDHNHKTDQLRGALCTGCNTRLAVLENPEWMKKATAYLEKWEQL